MVTPMIYSRYLKYESVEAKAVFARFYDFGEWSEVTEMEYDFDGRHYSSRPKLSRQATSDIQIKADVPHAQPVTVYIRRIAPWAWTMTPPAQWHVQIISISWILAAFFGTLTALRVAQWFRSK